MAALSLFNHFASPPPVIFFCILSSTCGLLVLALPCFHRSPCWMNAFSSRPIHAQFSDSSARGRILKRHVAHAFVLHVGGISSDFPRRITHACFRRHFLGSNAPMQFSLDSLLTTHPPRTVAVAILFARLLALPSHPKSASLLLPLYLLLSTPRLPRSHNHPPLSALHVLLYPLFRSSQAYISIDLSFTRYTLRSVSFARPALARSHLLRLAFLPACHSLSRLSSRPPPLFFTLDPTRSDGLRM